MPDLTVNTKVLMIASGKSDQGSVEECRSLLILMREIDTAKLVLDREHTIEQEYDNKMPSSCFGKEFVGSMAKDDKVNWVHRAKGQEWQKVRRPLHDKHFDPDDHTFVRTAMNSKNKRIVAEEADYSHAVKKVLKKTAGVQVDTAETATQFLQEHKP